MRIPIIAFYKQETNNQRLFIDEATASLDSKSEAIVQKAIDDIMKTSSITTVVIAHRLSTVKDTNQIAVLNKGKIEEIGTHQELLRKNGAYKRLIQAQEVTGKVQERSESNGESKKEVEVGEEVENEDEENTAEEGTSSEDNYLTKRIAARAFGYNKSEAIYIILGLIGAAMAGSAWPVSAIILSKMTVKLDPPDPTYDNTGDIRFLAFMFVAIGAVALVGNIFQMGFLGISGNRLTKKIRKEAFQKILSLDMAFFDQTGT